MSLPCHFYVQIFSFVISLKIHSVTYTFFLQDFNVTEFRYKLIDSLTMLLQLPLFFPHVYRSAYKGGEQEQPY